MAKMSPPKAYFYLRKRRRSFFPTPPVGFVFVVDSDGAYVTDEAGNYLLAPI